MKEKIKSITTFYKNSGKGNAIAIQRNNTVRYYSYSSLKSARLIILTSAKGDGRWTTHNYSNYSIVFPKE